MSNVQQADSSSLEVILRKGLEQLSIEASQHQYDQWLAYIHLLAKWNRAYNLSAVKKLDDMVKRHLLDSASVLPAWQHSHLNRVIDVGTGAGLPGIVMAIANPEANITLLDSNGKKTRFLFQVKTALKLDNIDIQNMRVESFQSEHKFDMVISRAYASLSDMVNSTSHLLEKNGQWWAMKGIYPEQEIATLPDNAKIASAQSLNVPFCEGERHLVRLDLHPGDA